MPILVTQTTEDSSNAGGDSDADNSGITALFTITKENTVINNTHVEDDGTETYELQYQNGNLTRFKHVERDDMDGASDKYCIETTTGTIFNSGASIKTDWNRKLLIILLRRQKRMWQTLMPNWRMEGLSVVLSSSHG